MFSKIRFFALGVFLLHGALVSAQSDISQDSGFFQRVYDDGFRTTSNPYSDTPWYKKLKINGYMQFRMNLKTNPNMECDQCDATYGGQEGFMIRRMRLKVSGFIHPKMYFYFQTDFASDGKNLGQLRDAYFDVYGDKNNTFWIRFGQSKVLYGFDNIQSSQNRIPLDRSDPINSAIKNERDLMLSFYYAPQKKKEIFSDLVKKGLKGSGNYGMFGLGFYNGQTANSIVPENNASLHTVLHFTNPVQLKGGQYLEYSLHGYIGKYQTSAVTDGVTASGQLDAQGNEISANGAFFDDARVATSFMFYPQPIGFQIEYNVGTGPEYDWQTNSIKNEFLHGGYFMLMGNFKVGDAKIYPFTRVQYYKGGKKFELDAREYDMAELEIGTEWSPFFPFEVQVTYSYAKRYYSDAQNPVNNNTGHLLRFQFQVNY